MKHVKFNELELLLSDFNEGNNHINNLPNGWKWQDTGSHGYLIANNHNIPLGYRSTRYSQEGRYEEDCDWCLPVLFDLELFTRKVQLSAVETAYHWHPKAFIERFKFYPCESNEIKRTEFKKSNKDNLVVYSAIGRDDEMVVAHASILGNPTAETRTFLIPVNEYRKRGEYCYVIQDPKQFQEIITN